MKFSTRQKAIGLLLIIGAQYAAAAATAADKLPCLNTSCVPKSSGGVYKAMVKVCPDGYQMTMMSGGVETCAKAVAKPCPAGTTANGGKCCSGTDQVYSSCKAKGNGPCGSGLVAHQECDKWATVPDTNSKGRRLQTFGSLLSDINIKTSGLQVVPILPQSAMTINIDKPAQQGSISATVDGAKVLPFSSIIPTVLLPEPAVTLEMPEKAPAQAQITINSADGSKGIFPTFNAVPVLPNPRFTIEVPDKMTNAKLLTVNLQKEKTKVVTLDMSHTGPEKVYEVNLPALPDKKSLLMGDTSVDVDFKTNGPAPVIDLRGAGPKKTVNVKLPEIKTPQVMPNINIEMPASETKYIDLTGGSDKTVQEKVVNIKLPSINVAQHQMNIDITGDDSKNQPTSIVLPGKGGSKVVKVNVPDLDLPKVQRKITVEINKDSSGKTLEQALAQKSTVEHVDVALDPIDLTGGKEKPKDINIKITAPKDNLFANKTVPKALKVETKVVDVTLPDINIGDDKQKDINVVIDPAFPTFQVPDSMKGQKVVTTKEVSEVNVPKLNLNLPTPKGGKVDLSAAFNLNPLKPLQNPGAKPDLMIDATYEEKWTGGKEVLPNPLLDAAAAAAQLASKMNTAMAGCPTKCCKLTTVSANLNCADADVEYATVSPVWGCPAGCSMAKSGDKCECQKPKVAACPKGKSVCKLGGKVMCVEDSLGCNPFAKVCAAVTGFQSC